MNKKFKNFVLNVVFPPRCIFCGTRLSPKVKNNVCEKCSNSLPYTRLYNRCKKCGKPMAENSYGMCKRCCTVKLYATKTTSPFVYLDSVKKAVIAFKKPYNAGFAKTMSKYIEDMVRYDFKNIEFDFVVSVPPRNKDLLDDSYDQAGELAKAVALRLGIPYLSKALSQTGRLKKQSTLTYNDRIKNVDGRFEANKPSRIFQKTILLIDDVCTSGATINECAKTLRKNGAYKIYAATFATVPSI